jgi:hypothetical protein
LSPTRPLPITSTFPLPPAERFTCTPARGGLKYRAEVQKLQQQEHTRKKALDDFLAALSAD